MPELETPLDTTLSSSQEAPLTDATVEGVVPPESAELSDSDLDSLSEEDILERLEHMETVEKNYADLQVKHDALLKRVQKLIFKGAPAAAGAAGTSGDVNTTAEVNTSADHFVKPLSIDELSGSFRKGK